MREIEVASRRYGGRYIVYAPDDEDCPLYRQDYWASQIGDWILSSDNVVAQVLDIRDYGSRLIVTAFGTDNVLNRTGTPVPLLLLRPRRYFSGLSSDIDKRAYINKTLTAADKSIIFQLLLFGNPVTAYEKATGNKVKTADEKYRINAKVKRILKHPSAGAYMKQAISQILKQEGVSVETWVKKLVSSTKGEIETPTQLAMHKMIGMMIPEVKEELIAMEDPDRVPSGSGRISIPEKTTTDAEFKDVCEFCDDTKKIKIALPGTPETEIPCPHCSKVQVEEVQEDAPALRV